MDKDQLKKALSPFINVAINMYINLKMEELRSLKSRCTCSACEFQASVIEDVCSLLTKDLNEMKPSEVTFSYD